MKALIKNNPKTTIAGAVTGAFMLALSFIPAWEGKTNEAIIPVAGDVPTICYGYTHGVEMGDVATDEECMEFLEEELAAALAFVDALVKVEISEYERAAYASFIYNLGSGRFKSSTMLRKLNAGDRVGACNEFPRWVYFQGRKLRGLVKRREAERELCLMGAR